jgi:transposase-like protein
MARFSAEDRETIWDMREAGVPVKRIAKHLDRQNSSLRRFIADHGGTRPSERERALSCDSLWKNGKRSPAG